jgi:hypothetical protein
MRIRPAASESHDPDVSLLAQPYASRQKRQTFRRGHALLARRATRIGRRGAARWPGAGEIW